MTSTEIPLSEAEELVVRLTTGDRRDIVPSDREVAAGAHRPVYVFQHVEDSTVARPSRAAVIVESLKRANPRNIEGPTRGLAVLGLYAATLGLYAGSFLLVLPDLATDFTFDVSFLAVLFGAGIVVSDVCGPVIGYVADRIKRVYLYRAAAVLFVIAMLRLVTAEGTGAVLLALVLASAASALPAPAQVPLLADLYPARSRVQVLSFLGAASVGGAVLGQVIGGFVVERAGWRVLIITIVALGAAAAAATFLLGEPVRGGMDRLEAGAPELAEPQAPPKVWETFRAVRSVVTVRRLWYASLFWPAGATGFAFASLGLAQHGMSASARGAAVAAAGAVTFVALPIVGGLVDKAQAGRPSRLLVVIGCTFFVQAGLLVLEGLSPWAWLSVALLIPLQFAVYAVPAALNAVYSLVVPSRMRGLGVQLGKPFEIASRLLSIVWISLGFVLVPYTPTPNGAIVVILALPACLAGVIVLGATPAIARDIRAALAVATADEDAKRAREAGRNKMLVCRQVEVAYDGVQVLFGIDLDVEDGEILALLGTNGAGKSTLMRAISGVQEASNGAIFLDGVDITHEPPHLNAARGVVMVP